VRQIAKISQVIEPGTRVDQYKVVRKIGSGGMGEIYLSQDVSLGRDAALKVVYPVILKNEKLRDQFFTEVQVMAKFSHPNIMTVYGVGEINGTPYAALEFLDGQTLRRKIKERLSIKESVQIGLSIAQALKEIHGQRILHRDIKPENIIILRDGTVRVVDFGLAEAFHNPQKKAVVDIESRNRKTNLFDLQRTSDAEDSQPISGTPLYMAPEQWLQEPLSGATDIWALGVILSELLSREPLFKEMDLFALRAMVCSKVPLPAPKLCSEVNDDLKEMVMRCLNKDPNKRPTAVEVADVLHELTYQNREYEHTVMELKQSKEELRLANKRLKVLATTDPLTGLYNRRRCLEILDGEISRVARKKQTLSLIMVDLDHFKYVNDTYGHGIGDAVLIEVSKRLKLSCRPHDAVGRWGGEEILIICPHTNSNQAVAVAERLCRTVSEYPFDVPCLPPISITASMGTASTDMFPDLKSEELIDCADDALYQAKNSGRNCVRASSVPAPLVVGA
jgi:diguanylate cyclase (GGDEF)-like protein